VRHPQVLVCESDGRLAALLRELADQRRWLLREPRHLEVCLRLLRRGGPSVLVLKVGRDLERDLTLLERVAWLRPDAGIVVVGDTDHAVLAGLAWDLGADFVLLPPMPRELLPDLVAGLMRREPHGGSNET
jgi:DNA-binding response OmpR family regulator